MNAESNSKIQRKKTITLKNAMEQRPSPEMVWQLQRENDLLTARIQELESASTVTQPHLSDNTNQDMIKDDYHTHTIHSHRSKLWSMESLVHSHWRI